MINKMFIIGNILSTVGITGTIFCDKLFKRENNFLATLFIYIHFLLGLLLIYAELDRLINKRKY